MNKTTKIAFIIFLIFETIMICAISYTQGERAGMKEIGDFCVETIKKI